MRRCFDVLLLSLLFVFGCEGTDPPDSDVGLNLGASKHQSHAKESGMVSKEVAAAANESGNAVTHADLEQQIARSADQSPWHYGERVVGELEGMWTAVDGSGHQLVFGADGSFSEDLAGHMTKGVYAISDKGRIVTFSKANGVGIGSYFFFEGKTIRGPRGPRPNAHWKRVTP
ncbi:hypothetical protein OAF83_03480 [Rubripirellula sp.]|nr:hypothetical protein [Rubripirellula sp.]MDB4749946.1 hypothetical protein [Rubripirellula sp.]